MIEQEAFNYFVLCTPRDTVPRRYIRDAGTRWYEHFVAAAIRRQADESSDTHSLASVMDQMAKNPEYALDWVGGPIDMTKLKEDRKQLVNVSKKAVTLASREVAHATRRGIEPSERPSIDEMHECVASLEWLVTQYTGLLSGVQLRREYGGLKQLIPWFLAGERFEEMEPTHKTLSSYFGLPGHGQTPDDVLADQANKTDALSDNIRYSLMQTMKPTTEEQP
jgi:hypothetical protein